MSPFGLVQSLYLAKGDRSKVLPGKDALAMNRQLRRRAPLILAWIASTSLLIVLLRRPNTRPDLSNLAIVGEAEPFVLPDAWRFQEGEAKWILRWTGDLATGPLRGCPDWNCEIFDSWHLEADEADAIIFHNWDGTGFHAERKPWQHFVFFTQESPNHMNCSQPYSGFFNLTMTYRRDSDVPAPYGYTYKLAKEKSDREMASLTRDLHKLHSGKTKPVAWFVSNCKAVSGSNEYVKLLQKEIPVDIYGKCGTLNCSGPQCLEMLSTDYHFYLALENSICTDYVTEKLWNVLANTHVIPIVLKRSIVEKWVPPQSFLAVDDFATPGDLAQAVRRISNDPQLYASFFAWRRRYAVRFMHSGAEQAWEQPWGVCRLCRLLHERGAQRRSLHHLEDWWRFRTPCQTYKFAFGAAPAGNGQKNKTS